MLSINWHVDLPNLNTVNELLCEVGVAPAWVGGGEGAVLARNKVFTQLIYERNY